jgi:hypothetical protein
MKLPEKRASHEVGGNQRMISEFILASQVRVEGMQYGSRKKNSCF